MKTVVDISSPAFNWGYWTGIATAVLIVTAFPGQLDSTTPDWVTALAAGALLAFSIWRYVRHTLDAINERYGDGS